MKTNTKIVYPTLGLIALNCFVLLLTAQALVPPPDGSYPGGNTAEGQDALFSLTTGTFNTTVGFLSGHAFTTGNLNTAVGAGALLLTHADENTATGAAALLNSSGGFANTANGAFALFSDTDGDFNTASGDGALFSNTTGNGNTALGINAGSSVTTASNVICIGADVAGANVDDSCFIGNIRNALIAPDAVPVLIDSAGKLGTTNGSSRRLKKEIKPMDDASEAILALKPVTFYYKTDSTNTPQFGLIAEEVAKIDPALVLRDKSGDIVSVRYDQVNAMLLNEFLKEHRKDEAQRSKIDEQDVTIGRLKSTLTRQQKKFESRLAQQEQQIEALSADFQKLAADVELKKVQPRTVAEK
ncbi:MAG: tail fiber domain-containing protein [Nitrospirota bacterium]